MPLSWLHATSAAISAQPGSLGPQGRFPRANGKRSLPELIVQVIACLAEGIGIRGASRVFEIDANDAMTCRSLISAGHKTCNPFIENLLHRPWARCREWLMCLVVGGEFSTRLLAGALIALEQVGFQMGTNAGVVLYKLQEVGLGVNDTDSPLSMRFLSPLAIGQLEQVNQQAHQLT